MRSLAVCFGLLLTLTGCGQSDQAHEADATHAKIAREMKQAKAKQHELAQAAKAVDADAASLARREAKVEATASSLKQKADDAKAAEEARKASAASAASAAEAARQASVASAQAAESSRQAAESSRRAAAAQASHSTPIAAGQTTTDASGKIVGNINSKIYHVPGQASYRMSADNAVYFNTEQEAQAAGYRKSLR